MMPAEDGDFYVSVFKNSKVGLIIRYGEMGPDRKLGHDGRLHPGWPGFTALNGGRSSRWKHSLVVNCDGEEIDYY